MSLTAVWSLVDVQASSLDAGTDGETSLSKALDKIKLEDISRHRPRKFHRMVTMTARELTSPAVDLKSMLQQREGRDVPAKRKQRSDDVNILKFEQIRSRKGKTGFEETESLLDPLRGIGTVFDVVCREEDGPHKGVPLVTEIPDARGDDYVYDIYIAEGEESDFDVGENWPVLNLVNDASWLVPEEASDKEDSDEDSEDSNAEGFYANDYPDEDASWSQSTDDEGWDGARRKKHTNWFDDSDDLQDGTSENEAYLDDDYLY